MHDIKWIQDNPAAFDAAMKARFAVYTAAPLIALDTERRLVITHLQELQESRNQSSKLIGKAKASGDESLAQELMAKVSALKDELHLAEENERKLSAELTSLLSEIPNMPFDEVPIGADEDDNVLKYERGEKPRHNFEPKQHFDLGEDLGMMDFATAAKLSGSRFVVLRGALARLERALGQYMLSKHVDVNGYEEVIPPLLVKDDALYGTSQLPKFREDLFRTEEGFWLIPTAEVSLTNLVRESVLPEKDLPKRFTALTPCFRSEAGSSGRDTRGMIRQHQFNKVEMVSVTHPDKSLEELERMLECAQGILDDLGLAYRVVTLSTGDMGFGARKTYDIEVWLPGQNAYREISSCSVCGDFQARRMMARFKPENSKKTEFVHTLNGSGLAVGRALVAVMENYQREDGSIEIPEVLKPYMGGAEFISKDG